MESTLISVESMDISKLKVPDLRRELKSRGLSSTGNKNDLAERLMHAMKSKVDDVVGGESVDDLEEDLLNDDDDEHLDGSESGITDLESPIDIVASQKPPKRKSSESSETQTKHAKKVVLNRTSTTENAALNGADDKDDSKVEPKKIVKLSELSAKERLEMRAKKFGVPVPVDAQRAARAERFGKSASIASSGAASVDVLKQRAERFGSSVSSVMSKLDSQEKLQKRKERFGLATSTNGAAQFDKAKQRLERFKQPVK